jgi:hypothetical protein
VTSQMELGLCHKINNGFAVDSHLGVDPGFAQVANGAGEQLGHRDPMQPCLAGNGRWAYPGLPKSQHRALFPSEKHVCTNTRTGLGGMYIFLHLFS